ncbi:MAG: hypothetical protein COV01_01930 [Candidatus Taylorbacteria bacterium CG10_big_fil_rev_8_21_14_0_10_41_48]|uniref:phenylalanine--tRNA ligase n=1 Tax=Candidatus Taylorbacteria bacterium CG10_big_fil_rev_8_21_14_0_10_41_48 TaxID=1975024 RepID=A0A2M8LCA0_9BACT|nr:MAG: hypothetical protein COV01_01930 [Candidatus Taylorbacteria bacterium CG10_big_fil_rev_8_21_14_0_10_41_48]
MKVSLNWLETYFEKPLPKAEVLAEFFNFHAFEVEGIEEIDGDSVLDVKVLPDRAHYALSHRGIAREVTAITGQVLKSDRIPNGPESTLSKKPKVQIEDNLFCRRYMARYAEVSKVTESNPHARVMLGAIGQRAINTIVDATNIVMFDMGQPLHIFDADKVVGTIVIRAAKDGEKIVLLDSVAGADREVSLISTDHVIADDEGPIAIAGVKGDKRAGVTDTTKNLIIESANFDSTSVRRTSTRLNLRSESSKRYENEITPEFTASGMNDVCALIAHNIPEAVFGPIVDIYPVKVEQTVIDFDPKYIEERLGVSVPLADARDILMRLDMGVSEEDDIWKIKLPFDRLDITSPIDIIEEIGRIYGYDKVPSVLPPVITDTVPMDKTFYWTEHLKDLFVTLGFSEVQTYTLVPKGYYEVSYPLASDKSALRERLAPRMNEVLMMNAHNADILGLEAVKVFEIGKVFTKSGEKVSLAIGVLQIKKKKSMTSESILKETIVQIEKMSGASLGASIEVRDGVAIIEVDIIMREGGNTPEFNGKISELDLGLFSKGKRYVPFSRYPFIVRDIALFTPAVTNEEMVREVIQSSLTSSTGELMVKGPDCFDRFEKGDKKSFAFRMIFQASDRTLSDEEVNGFMQMLYEVIKERGWEVR